MIGETIGHFRIVAEIGRGGMGVVYRAEDTRLHCNRALKFLPVTVTPDSPDHVRLVNEARALAALEHSNICPVQEIGEHNGQTFIVMSYLEGRTLKDRMAEGPIPLDEALEISRQISAGLAAAHAKGIVHRDVKPDNVMLSESNGETQGPLRAVLMDFGIAKNRDTTLVTRTGTVMGTAAYMSPEQVQGEAVSSASDVWAVGVMLFEMLAGKRPFQGDIEPALLYAIVNAEPEPLAGADQEVPESVERVIGKTLAKDRGNRYADAAELLVDFDRVIAGEAVKGRRLEKSRRGPFAGAVAALIAIALVALFVWPGFLATSDSISVLAVMPMEDRSEEGGQAYFSEGIADELATGLSKIGALTIVSRGSASRARELYSSYREIGSNLGVDAVIEGSVQREGDRVKVSVQLVGTKDDRLLWSDSFTRDLRDILNLQSEIALAISLALEAELTAGEQETLTHQRQIDPKAYEEYLIGNHFVHLATPESVQKAREHFEQALAIEPDFAPAHVGLTAVYVFQQQVAGLPPSTARKLIRKHANKAIEIEPNSAISHATLAKLAFYDWNLTAADSLFARARKLDPTLGMMDYAQYLNVVGRHQDALGEAQLATRGDPLDPYIRANLAARFFFADRFEDGLAEMDRLHEREPDFWISHWILGKFQIWNGSPVEAIESLRKAALNAGDSMIVEPDLAYALILADRMEEARIILDGLEKQAEEEYVAPYYLGLMYAGFGRLDEAFLAFDQALKERDRNLLWIETQFFSPKRELENDPRWSDLVRKINQAKIQL